MKNDIYEIIVQEDNFKPSRYCIVFGEKNAKSVTDYLNKQSKDNWEFKYYSYSNMNVNVYNSFEDFRKNIEDEDVLTK